MPPFRWHWIHSFAVFQLVCTLSAMKPLKCGFGILCGAMTWLKWCHKNTWAFLSLDWKLKQTIVMTRHIRGPFGHMFDMVGHDPNSTFLPCCMILIICGNQSHKWGQPHTSWRQRLCALGHPVPRIDSARYKLRSWHL